MRAFSEHSRMLAEYADIDIALDPFPYNGGLTTCEALWMGVPVLALSGESMISRQGASLLQAAGLESWIAAGPLEAIGLARAHCADLGRLAQLRAGLRETLASSPLLDGARFAAAFRELLLDMWRRKGGTQGEVSSPQAGAAPARPASSR
jgi:predicted O-linked N-acetylglucosamine transferase (SPINDLY family)